MTTAGGGSNKGRARGASQGRSGRVQPKRKSAGDSRRGEGGRATSGRVGERGGGSQRGKGRSEALQPGRGKAKAKKPDRLRGEGSLTRKGAASAGRMESADRDSARRGAPKGRGGKLARATSSRGERSDLAVPSRAGRVDARRGPPRDDEERRQREERVREGGAQRAQLRVVRGTPKPAKRTAGKKQPPAKPRPQRQKRRPEPREVRDEIMRLGGRRGTRLYAQVREAADAFASDREREAARLLQPLRDELPEAMSIRELLGLALYRLGRYPAAAKELEVYIQLSGSVDQHPVLMDCYRAQKKYAYAEELWKELGEESPSAELTAEGRIVLAGSRADQGRLQDAIRLLEKKGAGDVQRVKPYHLRLWYALADLEERAGNVPRARSLFQRIRKHDASFADTAERLAALG